ncbi:MAG: serine hydrolase, partial [Thermoanaerobaculia bacterium]
MKIRIAILVALLAASTILAQQNRVVRIGGGPPDELQGWPQPELRPGLSQPEIVSSIANYAQQLSDTDRFSGVVLVARDGKTLLNRAWGLADVASKTANTIDTKFNIGSINKVFTKLAIGQ